ncbi:hypothetical protein E6C76_21700 [Pseudothauera nasutitermitis]|uniref:Uncharacterized protein n=1 Tax=Pseudothauera nasutitermitis TaxID=2565930 RepID=A0A4V6RX38_9RHOO|nr:hypothetical protein [Pseudothauera nasutitermitis]THF60796.1 hypothetical protein E6C76_21700 [Pseudothauera nasutitermitis]
MIETVGLILGIVGVLFAFETPRRRVVTLFFPRSVAKSESSRSITPIIDICHRGISVKEIEPNKLHFEIPYCAGKNANAHNVKLQTAVLIRDGSAIKTLSHFGDDFPEGISLTYETGKSISYTLSPLSAAALSSLYIVVRGTYMAEVGKTVFPVFDIFKFSVPTKTWVRTLGDEDRSVRAFMRAQV